MINMYLIQRLRDLGFTRPEANNIFAAHLSKGTLDDLEEEILKLEKELKIVAV